MGVGGLGRRLGLRLGRGFAGGIGGLPFGPWKNMERDSVGGWVGELCRAHQSTCVFAPRVPPGFLNIHIKLFLDGAVAQWLVLSLGWGVVT